MNAMCVGMSFPNKQAALARARGLSRGHRRHLAPFRCSLCGRYHIHSDEPEKQSRLQRRRRLEELSLMERMEVSA